MEATMLMMMNPRFVMREEAMNSSSSPRSGISLQSFDSLCHSPPPPPPPPPYASSSLSTSTPSQSQYNHNHNHNLHNHNLHNHNPHQYYQHNYYHSKQQQQQQQQQPQQPQQSQQQQKPQPTIAPVSTTPFQSTTLPPPASIRACGTTSTMVTIMHLPSSSSSAGSSFPKRSVFHKLAGSITVLMIVISMAIVAAKRCTQAVAPDAEARDLNSSENVTALSRAYVAAYYHRLHIVHCFSLICAFLIVLLSFLDLVPTRDDDIKFAFHFVSIFIIFTVSLATLYASLIAFTRPCLAPDGVQCCTVRSTPGLFSSSDKKTITAISARDTTMIVVMVLDFIAGTLQLLIAIIYFRDVRREAAECGYLYRVHNEGYIIR